MRFGNFKSKLSFPALAISVLFFAMANVISYMKMDWHFVSATDMAIHCGFPFSFYYFSGWGAGVIWGGVIADLTVATVASFIVGVIWPVIKRAKRAA